jgi:two-component system KDP operon response regulator KdpE
VRLTPTEWHLLQVLTRHPGRVLSQVQLARELWPGPASEQRLDDLAASMAQLRHKLEPDPSRPRHLLYRPGAGYCFRPGPAPARTAPTARGRVHHPNGNAWR